MVLILLEMGTPVLDTQPAQYVKVVDRLVSPQGINGHVVNVMVVVKN